MINRQSSPRTTPSVGSRPDEFTPGTIASPGFLRRRSFAASRHSPRMSPAREVRSPAWRETRSNCSAQNARGVCLSPLFLPISRCHGPWNSFTENPMTCHPAFSDGLENARTPRLDLLHTFPRLFKAAANVSFGLLLSGPVLPQSEGHLAKFLQQISVGESSVGKRACPTLLSDGFQ